MREGRGEEKEGDVEGVGWRGSGRGEKREEGSGERKGGGYNW